MTLPLEAAPIVTPSPLTRGFTIWFTGLSGAGKSTLATAVSKKLRDLDVPVEVLDGDDVRQHLSQGLGFSRQDRDTNIHRIAYVASLLTRNRVAVISAAISPYAEARARARGLIGDFIEVFVDASIDTCIARDPKGLYQKAIAGVITAFTGISDPYEPPSNPDILVNTEREGVDEAANRILSELETRGYLAKNNVAA
jgi:adenylylsulfate kinase